VYGPLALKLGLMQCGQSLQIPKLCLAWVLLENLLNYKTKQFLLVIKATALKQQISKFYPQIQRTDAGYHIYVSQWPVINVKARRN